VRKVGRTIDVDGAVHRVETVDDRDAAVRVLHVDGLDLVDEVDPLTRIQAGLAVHGAIGEWTNRMIEVR